MSYHHFTSIERGRLEDLYKEGYGIRSIARKLSRSPSSISRELRRFQGSFYQAEVAQHQYEENRKHVGPKGKATKELLELIGEKLEATWSPEQIVGRLLTGILSVKTIYRWLYAGFLKVSLKVLRHKGKHQKSAETRGKFHVGTSIHKRPKKSRREKP